MDGKRNDDIKPGTIVKIRENRDSKDLIEGIVKDILTSSTYHPHGIKVRLENGQIGRVQEIINPYIEKNSGINLQLDPLQLIKQGENSHVEFKATFRFDVKRYEKTGQKAISKEVEKSISKTIAAFMNTDGGKILIGVHDECKVLGLDNDYEGLEKPESDKFRLLLKNSIQKYLRDKIVFEFLKIEIFSVNNKEICMVTVFPTPIPIFVHENDKQDCYVRVDNESKLYEFNEFIAYWQRHFSKIRSKFE